MAYTLDRPGMEFRNRPLLFIDFELSGLDPKIHEIIEVAALLVHQPDFSIVNSYYTKVKPGHPETFFAESRKVTGYDPKNWTEAIPLRQMLIDLSEFAPDCMLGGWVVQTEWDFLVAALEKENLPLFFDHRVIEVATLAFTYFYHQPALTHLNLKNAASAFDISLERHRPDSDIRATYEIFKKIMELQPKNPA